MPVTDYRCQQHRALARAGLWLTYGIAAVAERTYVARPRAAEFRKLSLVLQRFPSVSVGFSAGCRVCVLVVSSGAQELFYCRRAGKTFQSNWDPGRVELKGCVSQVFFGGKRPKMDDFGGRLRCRSAARCNGLLSSPVSYF